MRNGILKLSLGLAAVCMIGCGEKDFAGVSEASSQNASDAGGIYPPAPGGAAGSPVNTPPTAGVSTGGVSNPMPYTPPARTPAPTVPAPSGDAKLDFLRAVHKEVFRGTQYDHSVSDPTASLTYWRNRYNPGAGIGCRAIVEAFVLAHPTRPFALNAYGVGASGPDTALTQYIQMQYRALIPGVDPGPFYSGPQYSIYRWYVDRQISMTQLDALFLDHPVLQNRCAAAGLSF